MRRAVAGVILLIGLLLPACRATRKADEAILIDPAELQAFADEFFPGEMEALHITGLTFVLVQRGEVLYSQGYGYADLESETPMDEHATIVRIGSISKAFVATAVMQLAERRRIDLHTDVNEYLTTFKLEDTFPEPVTLAHLLTHTAGFEDPPYTSNTDPQLVEPLEAHLAEKMPPRTHRPGDVFVYSNYGYGLAALAVEEVSGTPFDRYVEQNILGPLGMTHSRYLLAPPLPEGMATGYLYQDAVQVPQPMDYDSDYPGGSIISTAQEMAHFILAHLQDGCYREACILEPATVAEMHQKQAETPLEGQNVTFGFVEGISDETRLVGHSGAIRGFGASLNLLPEHDVGYFFAFNAECHETTACQILPEFRKQFLKRFFQ